MNTISAASAAVFLAGCLLATVGFADDRPLIWKPSKNADTSYSVKLGLKLPTEIETDAGVSLDMTTTNSGALVDTPVRFWSNFTAEKIRTPAYQLNRDVGISMDGGSGSAAITMNYYEKEFATPSLDLERRSSYGMRYDGKKGNGVISMPANPFVFHMERAARRSLHGHPAPTASGPWVPGSGWKRHSADT